MCPKQQTSYEHEELLACGRGELFGEENSRLPLPNMLMMDRIAHIAADGGKHGKGIIRAELGVRQDAWFFSCHFPSDPVMPGCLGLDALWQLLGFHLAWRGHRGKGRALGVGEVKFRGEVLPSARLVQYEVHIKRILASKLIMALADGVVSVDERDIYFAKDLRVGLFQPGQGL